MNRVDGVLWDWDGTLINYRLGELRLLSGGCSATSASRSTGRASRPPTLPTGTPPTGLSTSTRASGPRRTPSGSAASSARFARCCLGLEKPCPPPEAAGLRQALVTSGSRARVEPDLARHELGGIFEVVICAEDVSSKKPDPEGLLTALDRMGLEPGQAAYVGDSPEDVEMARAAGSLAIAIPGGFPNREALQASPRDALTDDPLAAVAWLVDRSST